MLRILLLTVTILLTLTIGCTSKNIQSSSENELQEQFSYNNTEKEEQEQAEIIFIADSEVMLNRESVLDSLRKKGDKVLNINNLFEIKIPENIEIISMNQYLLLNRDKTQYGIYNLFNIVYQNKFFFIGIEIYGNTNSFILGETKTFNLNKIINPSSYMSKNQIIYLKEKYIKDPFINKNNVKISRLVSYWGTSWTTDYYGLYFMLPNNEFNECVISIDNIWSTFAKIETLDKNYKENIIKEGGNLRKIFQDLELMENSITLALSEDSIKIDNGSVGKETINDEYIFPRIDNLRMRNQPLLTGEILGYMEKKMYRIVFIGERAEIDGIEGNWIMIIPWHGNDISWVFSGFTRKATNEELDSYFGG
jgi:hypothetical protein